MRKRTKLLWMFILLGVLVWFLMTIPAVQNRVWLGLVELNFKRAAEVASQQFDGLRVFMCGTASPLPADNRAQACVAILAGQRILLVDAGVGSAATFARGRLPAQRIDTLLLTHFHSDHISGIADFNLASWVAGRPAPLRVLGPEGVTSVVWGLNLMYQQDRTYRVAHHGADLLKPEVGMMVAETIAPGVILDEGGLRVSAFVVTHDPIKPAMGYRFDYQGRSVVVSGDTLVVDHLITASKGADLVLHDALSLPLVRTVERVAKKLGVQRIATIMSDIQSYHANTDALATIAASRDFGMLALYHLVPPPQNWLMERIFRRGLPDDVVLTQDGMWFELPSGSDEIIIR